MTTGTAMTFVVLAAVATAMLKAIGPVAFGARELPEWVADGARLLGPALFAALVTTQLLADGSELRVGDQTAGVAVGTLLAWRGVPLVVCVLIAAAVTAAIRL